MGIFVVVAILVQCKSALQDFESTVQLIDQSSS